MQSSSADTNFSFGDQPLRRVEEINRHPQLVKKVELLVERGKTCLPDAAEAQQVTDQWDTLREDLLPVVNVVNIGRRRDLLHDQGLQDLPMADNRGLRTRLERGDPVDPNIFP